MTESFVKSRNAPPKASAMIEALRGLGYSPASALADIIDNSIAAGADHVAIWFTWAGTSSYLSILDNGTGMSPSELDLAMRLGERNPLDLRDSTDLGRFGLGLKTASFSQCRRLTVASTKEGKLDCLRWDLDVLAASSDNLWHLLEGPAPGSEQKLTPLEEAERGTLVLWEVLDRITTPEFSEQDFLDLMDRVEKHLAMVFHRYLEGARPRLRIEINGRGVAPWDPFLAGHSFTWSSPCERLRTDSGIVEVQCHVLPHRDNLKPSEYERAEGPDGWTAQQGFYVYRNERLLVAGSWLGLGHRRQWTKEEAHRLARIRVDVPNSADEDWKIDIRKAIARPPVSIRSKLIRLAEDTRERARRVFAHRGQIIRSPIQQPVDEGWLVERHNGGVRYRINEAHPAVKAVLDDAGDLGPQIHAMLRVIAETVPVQRIWLDTTEAREVPGTGFVGDAPAEVQSVLEVMYKNLVLRKGLSPALARERLLSTEPFHNYPALIASLPEVLAPNE